jgi:twitching motility protein PilT
MPTYLADGFSGIHPEEFEYQAPTGRVLVLFTPRGDLVRAELRPLPEGRGAAKVSPQRSGAVEVAEASETLQVVDTFDRGDEIKAAAAARGVSLPQSRTRPDGATAARPSQPSAVVGGATPTTLAVARRPGDCGDAMRELLGLCDLHRASDLHLTSGGPPALRIDGDIRPLEGWGAPSADELTELLWTITPPRNREQWSATKDTDFAHETGDARFRVNLFCDRSGIAAVLRRIAGKVFSAEEMAIPKELLDLCFLSKGLILVTAPRARASRRPWRR